MLINFRVINIIKDDQNLTIFRFSSYEKVLVIKLFIFCEITVE